MSRHLERFRGASVKPRSPAAQLMASSSKVPLPSSLIQRASIDPYFQPRVLPIRSLAPQLASPSVLCALVEFGFDHVEGSSCAHDV